MTSQNINIFIQRYEQEQGLYKILARALEFILKNACKDYAPLAMVQVREKSLASFIEKIKRKKYESPLEQMTDLCGARVITHTQSEVNEICSYINNYFIIDTRNSQNVLERLKEDEFGYRSIHFVVSLSDGLLKILSEKGFPEKELDALKGKKAEIQVRTILEHAWADICHDRMYKTDLTIPQHIKRELHGLAAILENADSDFTKLVDILDSLKNNFNVYMTKDEKREEIEALKDALKFVSETEKQHSLSLRIAKIARTMCEWDVVIDILKGYFTNHYELPTENARVMSEILLELGYAYCMSKRSDWDSNENLKGLQLIAPVADKTSELNNSDKKLKARALATLGWIYKIHRREEAVKYFRNAYKLDPGNPYLLASSIDNCREVSEIVEAAILGAIETCKLHIQSQLELPQSLFTKGRLCLLAGKEYECLQSYIEAIYYCKINFGKNSPEQNHLYRLHLLNEIDFVEKFNTCDGTFLNTVSNLLNIGMVVLFKDKFSLTRLSSRRGEKFNPKWLEKRLVIVVGGTNKQFEEDMQSYHDLFMEAFTGFEGSVISGGTKCGIPGVMGRVKRQLTEQKLAEITLVGYLPTGALTSEIECDKDNYIIYETGNGEFSPGPPIQSWVDIISTIYEENGLSGDIEQLLSDVLVVGVGGGRISAIEYRIALALGVKVGVVRDSGRAVSELINDPFWENHPGLLTMPNDGAAFHALIKPAKTTLLNEKVDSIAREIHRKYVDHKKESFPVLKSWEALANDLKRSNLHQVEYFEEILKSINCGLREARGVPSAPEFEPHELITMARLEHGRFCTERLMQGWKYGKEKDETKKISPYIISWDEIEKNEEALKQEVQGIKDLIQTLLDKNMEIYRL